MESLKEPPTELLGKLNEIMADIGQIEKTGHNSHFGYDFVEKDDVYDEFRESFIEYDIHPVIDVGEAEVDRFTSGDKDRQLTRCVIELTLVDLDSGETISYSMPGQGLDGQDKGVSKAAGLAVKYILLNNFLIDSGDDDPDTGHRSSGGGKSRGGSKSGSSGGSGGGEMTDKPGTVTDKQKSAIYGIASDKVYEHEESGNVYEGKDEITAYVKQSRGLDSLNDLSKRKASALIDWLKDLPEDSGGGEEEADPEEILDDVEVDKEDDIPF